MTAIVWYSLECFIEKEVVDINIAGLTGLAAEDSGLGHYSPAFGHVNPQFAARGRQ